MRVNYYAMLREIVGQRSVDFDLPLGTTINQLVALMVSRYPGLRGALLDEHGNLYGHVQVFINGRDALLLDDQLETILQPADVINIFPAVGGGGDES